MINKSRLIITSVISIVLVSILLIGSTYSIFTSQEIDEDTHVYKTGNLDVTYTLSESEYIIENSFPILEDVVSRIKPYRITVTNTGNVTYQFDLILSNTQSSNTINYQYIKTKVGKLDSKRLSDCTNNIIKEDVILLPGKSVDIDVRIWVSNDIASSEMGKSFYAKLSVDGLAVYNDNQEIDNSMLADPLVYLNSVEPGSYVKYAGDNGCDNTNAVNGYTSCSGMNANATSTNKGYCHDSSYSFNSTGWRVGYIEYGSAHLVSAGSPECVATYVETQSTSTTSDTWSTAYYYSSSYTFDDSTGQYTLTGLTSSALDYSSNYESIIANTPYTCMSTTNTATCSTMYKVDSTSTSSSVKYYTFTSGYETTSGAPKHLANLNNKALKYCNKAYAKGGVCNNTTAWAMNASDFEKITGSPLSSSSCSGTSSEACGLNDTLIDNGGYYWYAKPYSSSSYFMFLWNPYYRRVSDNYSGILRGVRPVLALESSIIITGGKGIEDDPYIISKAITISNDITYLNTVEPGSYVKYAGNNGCDDTNEINGYTSCSGKNANATSTNKGYCNSSSYQFVSSGWRVGYVEDGSAHLVSAGSPECVATYVESQSTSTTSSTWSTAYYYGSGYTFDESTGKYTLTGLTSTALAWSNNYQNIIANTSYTCRSATNTATCSYNMYKVDSTSTSSSVKYYTFTSGSETTSGAPKHLANLNNKALKYCNKAYAKGGVCNSTTSWAMNASDFEKITGSPLNSSSCLATSSETCGLNDTLIDNGGYYWYATPYSSSSRNAFRWYSSSRYVSNNSSNNLSGVRPVLALESSIIVTGGTGTYTDPYIITN